MVRGLKKILPAICDGFSLIPDSENICYEDNLTEVYDGGYYEYVEVGVTLAVYSLYSNGSNYFSTTLRLVNNEANVSNLLNHFRSVGSSSGEVEDVEIGQEGFRYDISGMSYLFFSQENLFVSIEGYGAVVKGAIEDCAKSSAYSVPENNLLLAFLIIGGGTLLVRHRRLPKWRTFFAETFKRAASGRGPFPEMVDWT